MGKIQVYCGISLDGYIAGPDDDLGWLEDPDPALGVDPGIIDFHTFMGETGALLMGRRTFDVVMGFGVEWPYGETPVLIATNREMPENAPPAVTVCSGDIADLCEQARRAAGSKNVYIDGGGVITQALEASLIDELILTVQPVLLGSGVPLFNGARRQRFRTAALGNYGGLIQLKLTPKH